MSTAVTVLAPLVLISATGTRFPVPEAAAIYCPGVHGEWQVRCSSVTDEHLTVILQCLDLITKYPFRALNGVTEYRLEEVYPIHTTMIQKMNWGYVTVLDQLIQELSPETPLAYGTPLNDIFGTAVAYLIKRDNHKVKQYAEILRPIIERDMALDAARKKLGCKNCNSP